MEVHRSMTSQGGLVRLHVRASLSDAEAALLREYNLLEYRIHTRDGPFGGRTSVSANIKGAFRVQFGKVKNRWSTALVRTSGWILADVLLRSIGALGKLMEGLFKLFFGRRLTLGRLIRGVTIQSRRIERIKEAELFIFVSLAAISKALRFAEKIGVLRVYAGDELLEEVEGLDFAGAGNQIETEFDDANDLLGGVGKAGHLAPAG